MSGPQLLIVAIIVTLVTAFIITMIVINRHSKKMFSINSRLVANHNTLLDQNKQHEDDERELRTQINELEEELKLKAGDKVTQLREQTRQYRENIELTTDISDEDLSQTPQGRLNIEITTEKSRDSRGFFIV